MQLEEEGEGTEFWGATCDREATSEGKTWGEASKELGLVFCVSSVR